MYNQLVKVIAQEVLEKVGISVISQEGQLSLFIKG